MTKPKGGPVSAEKVAALLLRAAVTKQLRDGGPQNATQVHAAIGGDFEQVRHALYRLVKNGAAKSTREVARVSTFRLSDETMVIRDVAKPFRPVLKEWAPNHKRDTLHCFLFGLPEMRVAA